MLKLVIRVPCRICYRLTVVRGYNLNFPIKDRPTCRECYESGWTHEMESDQGGKGG